MANCASELRRVNSATDWFNTLTTVSNCSLVCSGEPISTTITRSTFICRAISTGILLAIPPSTSKRPCHSTGDKIAGIDILARTARGKCPSLKTTASPVAISAATARNGIGNWSKCSTALYLANSFSNSKFRFCPCNTPIGKPKLPSSLKLIFCFTRKSRSSCLRR